MKFNLTIGLVVDTEKLPEVIREDAESNTTWQGFPINDENTAWAVGEMIAEDWSSHSGIQMEMIP